MKVVVLGATGNVGTSLVRALADAPEVEEVVGVARRLPALEVAKARWAAADVERDDLEPLLRGAGAVVHLAWRIQPSHDLGALWRTNVLGSQRVFDAAARAGVPALVHASSVGVYSPGPKDRRVDERWPRLGVRTSFYASHKAEVERRLDRLERERPELRVVRLRPALVFKRGAASGIRRLFAGPLLPSPLLRRELAVAVPDIPGLRFQAVHADDLAEAYSRAVLGDVRGAFNAAADPVLDPPRLAELAGARLVRVPAAVARAAAALTWHARLQPTSPGWLDLALGVPLMDTGRAERELGWAPRRTSEEALLELLQGLREGAGESTPPLDPSSGGPLRLREVASGLGGRE